MPNRYWSLAGEVVPVTVDRDDGIRPDFTLERLSKLHGCFKRGGVTTAGNACQVGGGGRGGAQAACRCCRRVLGLPCRG